MLSASKVNAVRHPSSLECDKVELCSHSAASQVSARLCANRSIHNTKRSLRVRSLRFPFRSIPIIIAIMAVRQHAQGALLGALAYRFCVRLERYLVYRFSAAGSDDGTCVASAEADTFETGR